MLLGTLQAIHTHLLRLQREYTVFLVTAIALLCLTLYILSAPSSFNPGEPIVIPVGTSVSRSGLILREHHAIRSQFLFRVVAKISGTHSVQAGVYIFPSHVLMPVVLWHLRTGETGLSQVKVTFPEGFTARDMSNALKDAMPTFDSEKFYTLARADEGYLFPDTYFFMPGVTPEAVIAILKTNYERHASWRNDLPSGMSERDAVILASIVEAEARAPEDMKIVAGILERRLQEGHRLQVDAPFGYERGVRGYTPTKNDIETPTPYNTYRKAGLPPTPINNPGENALNAVVHPTQTKYLFYITGADGKMYYSTTFAEHQQMIKLHLQ